VQEFKYLGFNLDRKGDYKRYIKEISRKGKMEQEKYEAQGKSRNDFSRRWMLFKYLVQSMAYGMELWDWEEKGELEKKMLDYVRIFKLDFCIPRYVIMKELVMDKLKVGGGFKSKKIRGKD